MLRGLTHNRTQIAHACTHIQRDILLLLLVVVVGFVFVLFFSFFVSGFFFFPIHITKREGQGPV